MIIILYLYGIIYLHLVIHELSHFIVAKAIKVKINKIAIGREVLALHIGKLSISPLPGGFVEVDSDMLLAKSRFFIFLFFEAGPLANLLFSVLFVLLGSGLKGLIAACIGFFLFLGNNLFFVPGSDGANIWRCFRQKNEAHEIRSV